jgi:predicted nucleotide-binding protein (sugar kinase/HSP70/actin superfamily)
VDNLRWAVADKVVARVFETCSLEYLEQLMAHYFEQKFKKTLEKSVLDGDSLTRYLTVREKTHVFLLIEICVRRLDSDALKNKVTKQIYGQQAPANELTKYLIKKGEEASKGIGLEDFIKSCDSLTQEIELP